MPILYSVVSRGTVVLANYAACPGNFSEVSEQILAKIAPEDGKLTFSHNSYLFHYICENSIIYMCITDDEFERSRAFLCLNDIQRKFISSFGTRANTAIAYAMNNEFSPVLAGLMKHFSESKDIDTMSRVHGELDQLKGIMVKNIENFTARGEKLELLVDKADNLRTSTVSFRTTSRNLQRSLFWKNVKLWVIIAVIFLVVAYILLSITCGGLSWPNC